MLTVQAYPIGPAAVRLLAAVSAPRTAVLINDGLCPVWLGPSTVEAGAGRRFEPGEVATYVGLDELYGACHGNPTGSVTVDEQRSGS